jgi:hypothetical protein
LGAGGGRGHLDRGWPTNGARVAELLRPEKERRRRPEKDKAEAEVVAHR